MRYIRFYQVDVWFNLTKILLLIKLWIPDFSDQPVKSRFFLDVFNVKTKLNCNPRYHMEPSDIKTTILVVGIIINDNFLSLLGNPATPSLFSNKKRLKNNENEV